MSYLDKISIVTNSAVETYSKLSSGPVEVEKGEHKTRLSFSRKSNHLGEYTCADVYIEVIGNTWFDKKIKEAVLTCFKWKFVKATQNGKTIFININSLSQRLGISKSTIKESQQSKDPLAINKVLQIAHQAFIEREEAIDAMLVQIADPAHYEDLTLSTYKTKDGNGGLTTRKELRKMLGIAEFSGFNKVAPGQKCYQALSNGEVLLLEKRQGDRCPIMTLITNQVLGHGFSGEVRVVKELTAGRVSVAKIGRSDHGSKNIRREYEVRREIYENAVAKTGKPPIGIQQPGRELVDLPINGYSVAVMFTKKFDCDLFDAIKKKMEFDRIGCADQLFQGVVELHRQKMPHGDLKEENCLVGARDYVISDLEGAGDLSDDNNLIIPHCWSLISGEDRGLLDDFKVAYRKYKSKGKGVEGGKQFIEDYKQFIMSIDVYCFGDILHNLFKEQNFAPSQAAELSILINAMRDSDWRQRPTIAVAYAEYRRIMGGAN